MLLVCTFSSCVSLSLVVRRSLEYSTVFVLLFSSLFRLLPSASASTRHGTARHAARIIKKS